MSEEPLTQVIFVELIGTKNGESAIITIAFPEAQLHTMQGNLFDMKKMLDQNQNFVMTTMHTTLRWVPTSSLQQEPVQAARAATLQ